MLESDAILKTRKHFAKIALDCVREAKSGEVNINPEYGSNRYISEQVREYKAILRGKHDNTITFQQYKNYLQTGICYPILIF